MSHCMILCTLPHIVDCEWNEWTVGDCSLTCGGGNLTKTRTPKVDKLHGEQNCTGHAQVTESCNVQECPGKTSQYLTNKRTK